MLAIRELPFEAITIYSSKSFHGLEVLFRINNYDYQFLIGKANHLFPINVKHKFKEKAVCPFCQKKIYAAPLGQQLCLEFQKNLPALLQYFQEEYPDAF
ncbi:hypothetical protein [Niallia sp.]|uniref:hypothetical protein n=1 Tax=Niallia sp. TaxID=2837523 RepID=UPI0028A279E3|nr:hypothetical protein [Niallia sp.]